MKKLISWPDRKFSDEEVKEIAGLALMLGKDIAGYRRFGYGSTDKILPKLVKYRDIFQPIIDEQSKEIEEFGKYHFKIPE